MSIKIKSNTYTILENLGDNTPVYKVINEEKKLYVIKILDLTDRLHIIELSTLLHSKHKNILNAECFDIIDDNLFIVMPYLMSLKSYLDEYKPNNDIKNKLIFELASAINYLMNSNIYHLDIKPSNIFIELVDDNNLADTKSNNKDDKNSESNSKSNNYIPTLKLGDFGIAAYGRYDNIIYCQEAFSDGYRPPEEKDQYEIRIITEAQLIWSYGKVVSYICGKDNIIAKRCLSKIKKRVKFTDIIRELNSEYKVLDKENIVDIKLLTNELIKQIWQLEYPLALKYLAWTIISKYKDKIEFDVEFISALLNDMLGFPIKITTNIMLQYKKLIELNESILINTIFTTSNSDIELIEKHNNILNIKSNILLNDKSIVLIKTIPDKDIVDKYLSM